MFEKQGSKEEFFECFYNVCFTTLPEWKTFYRREIMVFGCAGFGGRKFLKKFIWEIKMNFSHNVTANYVIISLSLKRI